MKRFTIQLNETGGGFPRGKLITATGGVCFVAAAAGATKVSLQDKDGATLSNPVSLTQGGCEFYTANTVESVDLYLMAPGGQFVTKTTVKPGHQDIEVDVTVRNQVAMIPFSAADQAADATETSSGFSEPANAMFTSVGAGIRVITADATETVDIGTDSTASGDANGFLSLASVTTAAVVAAGPVVTTGTNETYYASTTVGALLVDFVAGTDLATDVGTNSPKGHVSGDKSITYTLTTGSDTAEGIALLPYYLAG